LRRTPNYFPLIAGIVSLCNIAIAFSLFLSQTVFFDKFVYSKSHAHGYFVKNTTNGPELFGKRAEDLTALYDTSENADVLGVTTGEDEYTIAVFGDSYVWGQGLLEKDRFVSILEKKLNTLRKTKIISLAMSGDSLFDNFAKYEDFKKQYEADYYIFGIVDNDLEFREKNKITIYDSPFLDSLVQECWGEAYIQEDGPEGYEEMLENTTKKDSKNYCVFSKLEQYLPRDKAVYINLMFYPPHPVSDLFDEYFTNNNFRYIRVYDHLAQKNVSDGTLFVSEKDPHPSAWVNEQYANILFNEITTSPYSNF
jgi:hypothetical protein